MSYQAYEGHWGGMSDSSWNGNIGNVRKRINETGGYGVGALGPAQQSELSYDDTVASKNAAKSNYYDSDGKLKDGYISSTNKLGGFGDAVLSWDSRASADYDHMHSDEEDLYLRYGHEGLHIYNKSTPAAPAPAPTPKSKPVIEPTGPVEYSSEIQQAKERTNKYESDLKDGNTSQNIYAKDSYINRDTNVSNKYDFSAKTFGGASNNATPADTGSQEQASKATASFLDNKKSQVKNQYQLQAQS